MINPRCRGYPCAHHRVLSYPSDPTNSRTDRKANDSSLPNPRILSCAWRMSGDSRRFVRSSVLYLTNSSQTGRIPFDYFFLGILFSGGAPFEGVPDDEVVKRVRSGELLSRPTGSATLGLSDAVWEVTQRCWHSSPRLRLRMVDVLEYTRRM